MGGRLYAWRAALRIARRDAWRNKGRSALVAIMVALPVLAVSAVDVIARSAQFEPRDVATLQLGEDAQARISVNGGEVQQQVDGTGWGSSGDGGEPLTASQARKVVTRLLSPRDRLVPDVTYPAPHSIRSGDRAVEAEARELDYTGPGLAGLLEQVSGRPPEAEGEVVVTEAFRRHTGAGVGDTLQWAPGGTAPRPLTVVGVVGGPSVIGIRQVVGMPGTFAPAGVADRTVTPTVAWLVVGPDRVSWDQVLDLNRSGMVVVSRGVLADPPPPDRVPYEQQGYDPGGPTATTVGVVIVAVGLILLQIALLAGPAIAVGARRNQRALAVVAAGGADRRHLRAVVLATSGVVGLVGCAIAAVLGIGVGALGVVAARRYADYQLPRIDVHPLDLLGLVLLGAVTAVAASLIPARQAARLDVVAALTGRRGQAPPRLRVPLLGLLVALAGAVTAFAGAVAHQPLVTVIGIALGEVGLVAATGALVGLAARAAGRLPLSARFALRDAARQRGRTAPAVAAVMAAIAGSTAALLYVAAQDRADRLGYTPSAALGVATVSLDAAGTPPATAIENVLRRELPVDRVALLRAPVVTGSTSVYVDPKPAPAYACPVAGETPPTPEQERVLRSDPRCTRPWTVGQGENVLPIPGPGVVLDDGTGLAVLTGTTDPAAAAALRAGRAVVFEPQLLWPDGTVHLTVNEYSGSGNGKDHTVVLPGAVSRQEPRVTGVVLPTSAAARLGTPVAPTALVAATSRMPTDREEERAAAALQDLGGAYLTVERGYVSDYGIGLLALVIAAVVVTLGGTFTAVGLAAAEGRADHATLAAVGASPGLRRRLAAAQAGVIAGLGAAFGLASGVLAGWALVRLRGPAGSFRNGLETPVDSAWHLTVPWWHLAAVAIGVPLLTVLVGFVGTRSRLPLVRRLGQ